MADSGYDPGNIFAKILRGEIPAHTVYEDAHTLAFMDVMPQADGHTLVITKAPARDLLDADADTLAALIAGVQRVARGVKAAFGADGITVSQFNGPAAGQTVFHLHVHVIPRREEVPLRRHAGGSGGGMADGAVLAEHAARIRAALEAQG